MPRPTKGCRANDNDDALREECGLRVSESRVMRKIYGPKRKEIVGLKKIA